MEHILQRARKVTSEWHVEQASRLLDYAERRASPTALVYASLEIRMALERFVFEMSVLVGGGVLTPEELQKASHKGGAFKILGRKIEDYRRHLEFCNVVAEVACLPIRIPIPDVRRFQRLITEISAYCHFQADPAETIDDSQQKWFLQGVAAVWDATKMLSDLVQAQRGAMPPNKMAPEVRELFNRYLSRECDIQAARIQLELMSPVLEARMKHRSG